MRVSGQGLKLAGAAALLMAGAGLLWACGGGGSGLASRPAGPAAADSGTAIPAAETTPGPAGLQAIAGWPQFPAANYEGPYADTRRVSASELAVDGQAFAAQAGANNYLVTGTNAYVICPGGDDPLAFAQYAVPGLGAERPVDWSCEITAAPIAPGGDDELPLSYFIGLANYTNGLWDWRGPYSEPQTLTLNSQELRDRFVSANGVLHFVLATVAGPQFASPDNADGLTALRIEQCLVGVEDGASAQYFATKPPYTELTAAHTGSAVKGLAALDPEQQYVTLTWNHINDPLNNYANEADSYEVRRLARGASVSELLSKPSAHSGENSFLDNGALPGIPALIPGQTYLYQVRAENESGYTPFASREVTIPLLPPTDLQASDGSFADHIELTWTRAEGAQGYDIYRDGQDTAHKIGSTGDAAGLTDSAVPDFAVHTYYVRSVNMYAPDGGAFSQPDTGWASAPPYVVLEAAPLSGTAPLTVDFDASASFDPDDQAAPAPGAGITNFQWDWESDGTYDATGAEPTITHEYVADGAYIARVQVWDDEMATNYAQVSIAVNLPGTASVSGTVTYAGNGAGIAGVTVTLPGGGSGLTNMSGGYTIASVPNGNYDAAAAKAGMSFLPDSRSVSVSGADVTGVDFVGYGPPMPQLLQDTTSGTAPLTVNYDATSSYDTDDGFAPGAGITKYEWDWDNDGTYDFDSGTDPTVAHVYAAGGSYRSGLRVTDNDLPAGKQQQTETLGSTVYVNEPPVADLQADPTSGPAPLQVSFDASASSDSDGSIVDYEWDFDGDGTFNESGAEADARGDTTAQYTYYGCGTFPVTVRVIDDDDASGISSIDVKVVGWAHSWGLSGEDKAFAVASHSDGSIYLAGTLDNYASTLLIKYDSSRNLQWCKTWDGAEPEYIADIALDNAGNIYAAGATESFGSGNKDSLLLKYSPNGSLLWQKVWGESAMDYSSAIGVDADGNIYVAGSTSSFGGYYEPFLLKYNSSGAFVFQKTWTNGTGPEYVTGMQLDNSANIYLCGTTIAGFGSDDTMLLKFNTSGAMQWGRAWCRTTGTNGDFLQAVDIDNAGNIYVSGYTNADGGQWDALLIKYNANGDWQWGRIWGDSTCNAYGVNVDSLNNIFVSGWGTLVAGEDCFLLKYDVNGNLAWSKAWGTAANDKGYSVLLDSNNMVLLPGYAPNNTGTWQSVTRTSESVIGSGADLNGTLANVSGTASDVSGTSGSPAGTEDSGGGGADALIIAGVE